MWEVVEQVEDLSGLRDGGVGSKGIYEKGGQIYCFLSSTEK